MVTFSKMLTLAEKIVCRRFQNVFVLSKNVNCLGNAMRTFTTRNIFDEKSAKSPCCTLSENSMSAQHAFWCCENSFHLKSRFCTSSYLHGVCSEDGGETEDEDILGNEKEHQFLKEICHIPDSGHRVIVIQPDSRLKGKSLTSAEVRLEETCALVRSVPRWKVVDKMVMRTRSLNTQRIFGRGNFALLQEVIQDHRRISAVVMSIDFLKRAQLDTLESAWGLPVLDRYAVVLQIFKCHARSKEAKVQVALAEIPYLRSRVHRVQIAAGQSASGSSAVSPSHLLLNRETKLQKLLSKLKEQRQLLRKNRQRQQIPSVAVVGYTNAGKTTLIQALTGDMTLEPKDQLFATLDVMVHGGKLPNKMSITFIDTVGFIADIPVSLIEAFSATLEDAIIADVIVHIRDISHPDTIGQRESVLQTLKTMLPTEKISSIIEVGNKADKLLGPASCDHGLLVSAVTGQGLAELREAIQQAVISATGCLHKTFRIPADGPHLSWLYKKATVMDCRVDGQSQNLLVSVLINETIYGQFKAAFKQTPAKVP